MTINKKNYYIFFFACQLIILLTCLVIYSFYLTPEDYIKDLVIYASFLVSIILCVFLARKMINIHAEDAETAVKEATSENMITLIKAKEEQNKNFEVHIQNISGLFEKQQFEELANYLKKISKSINNLNSAFKVDQPVIGALLNSKLSEADVRDIRLEIEVATPLSRYEECSLELARILGNLIDNSFDAVLSGQGHEKVVAVSIKETGPLLKILVHNTGPAIPRDRVDSVFTGGYTSKGGKHSGLGLSIVKTLAEKISGAVGVKSDDIHGTSFTVTIPSK